MWKNEKYHNYFLLATNTFTMTWCTFTIARWMILIKQIGNNNWKREGRTKSNRSGFKTIIKLLIRVRQFLRAQEHRVHVQGISKSLFPARSNFQTIQEQNDGKTFHVSSYIGAGFQQGEHRAFSSWMSAPPRPVMIPTNRGGLSQRFSSDAP